MSRTINRLSDNNALLSYSTSSGLAIPLYGATETVSNVLYYGDSSVVAVPLTTKIKAGNKIQITLNSASVYIENVLTASPHLASNVTGTYEVTSVSNSSSVSNIYFKTISTLSAISLASGSVSFVPTTGEITPIYADRWKTPEYLENNVLSTRATLSVTSEGQSNLDVYALKISPSTSSDVTIYLPGTELVLADNSRRFSFNAKVHPSVKSTITALLSVDGETIGDGYSQEIFGGRYGAARSNTVTIPQSSSATYSVSASITFSGHEGQPIYMTLPHLIDDQMYYENTFVNQARLYMPDFYWDIDYEQVNPIAPFHRLIDCLFNIAGETYEMYREYFPYEVNEIAALSNQLDKLTNSTLVNPNFIEPRYMTWLAQFNGAKLKRNIIGSDGSRLYDSTSLEDEYSRWQLLTGYYGNSAGSRDAISSAAKKVLYKLNNSSFSVAISRRYLGDPFKIQIITLVAETPDVDAAGEESFMVLDAVEPARPMGYAIYHTTVDEFEFTLDNDTLGILDEFPLG